MLRVGLFVTVFLLVSVSLSWAVPKVTYSIPYGAVQQGFWSGVSGSTVEILPPAGWNAAVNGALSAMYRNDVVATIGSVGVSRAVIGSASKLLPYVGLALTAYMTYKNIRDAASSDPVNYPHLANAVTGGAVSTGNFSNTTPLNGWFTAYGRTVQYKGYHFIGTTPTSMPDYYPSPETGSFTHYSKNSQGTYDGYQITYGEAPVITDGQLINSLNGGVGQTAYDAMSDPAYRDELDAMFKAGDDPLKDYSNYNIMYNDAKLALDSYNSTQQSAAAAAAATASTAAAAAAVTATNNYNTAVNNYNTAAAAAASNPTDPSLAAAAAAAKSAADAAKLAADQAAAVAAAAAAQQAQFDAQQAQDQNLVVPSMGTNVYDSSLTAPDKKDLGGLLGLILGSSPLMGITGGLGLSLTAETSIYTFNFPDKLGGPKTIDFAMYESTWVFMGIVFVSCAHISAAMIVLGIARTE